MLKVQKRRLLPHKKVEVKILRYQTLYTGCIFSIEQNARNTAEVMNQLNIQPTVKEQTSRNKTFWRVIVGPAVDMNERSTLLQKVKAVGFGDAYAVSK